MNILLISSYLPYPLYSGGHIRLYNLLKLLSKKHSITLVCEKRNYQSKKDEDEVKKVCSELITVDRIPQWSIMNILKSGFSLYPFLLVGHTNKDLKKTIKKQLANSTFDIIHVETSYVFQNIPQTTVPIVLVEHNIEYLVYKKYANGSPFFLKPILYMDILKLRFWEKRFWKRASHLVAVSEEEKKFMDNSKVSVVPNGVDIEKFKIKSPSGSKSQAEEIRILFIGDFKWVQNKDAVSWLLEEIWPLFIKVYENKSLPKLWVVGKNIPNSIKKLNTSESVFYDEDASEKTEEIYKKASLLVAPIRVGGGSRYKILEAMASGTPVVSTTLGIEGITLKNGKEVLVADDPESFAMDMKTVLENSELKNTMVKKARMLVSENYDWKIIVKKLEEVYNSVVS
ncbi:MAG: hypothetical protein A3F31_04800 [Candidatus Levybacteria bacterium RIFCSPHIGHO2_12_FULL_38_12]|nr:MAG: hypothetical protein A2770_04485 [Candidatus Levybacteria bacterium RIFCSPHIGHO2_01_FULL_38_12]OGH21771.1 MAG: hypothetical protein A3D75_01105 [Candidatus Levybacteria bacterium RIFCSPHIGHO2_02_FULL_37_18]OGH22571.1 MAG: hypothetical protein A3F31_04800 [Candidatus Levybacteria bacterium RIFCSPHIGHO2_12_FULL_38_12]OGH33392.1 MAG: hypothetical protein A3A47_04055 [Candidatus Levybacteria bacterium RIFCSPLOWO2_01_FULL_37_20]OGH44109.1 MAG: hypothetical protein A3J14_05170 [Candidatus Lev